MDRDREGSTSQVTKRWEHPLLVVARTIAAACGAALLLLGVVAVPGIAANLGIAKAAGVAIGLALSGGPLVWAGVTGRGAMLEDARDRLDALREHAEAYHAGRLDARRSPVLDDGSMFAKSAFAQEDQDFIRAISELDQNETPPTE